MTSPWSERSIARALALQTFQRRHLVLVPNCIWTGSECDLLVVTANLRIIDVEVKISRADLKADAGKDKWFHSWDYKIDGPWRPRDEQQRRPREWPRKVWKHYYAMPRAIWTPELDASLGSSASGVLLLEQRGGNAEIVVRCERRAYPNRDAERIKPEDAVDIARLASLRMWDAYAELERHRQAPAAAEVC